MEKYIKKCQKIMNCANMLDLDFDETEECEYYTAYGNCCNPNFYFTENEIENFDNKFDDCGLKDVLMCQTLVDKLAKIEVGSDLISRYDVICKLNAAYSGCEALKKNSWFEGWDYGITEAIAIVLLMPVGLDRSDNHK